MVIAAAADWDYRLLVRNWYLHAQRFGYSHSLVLAMDSELDSELRTRGIPTFDASALVGAWNETCLQRHIQAVRVERHIAVAALLSAGYDVLLTDATCVFTRDFVPSLVTAAARADADVLAQRDTWPTDPVRKVGTAANAGLLYVRASKRDAAVRARSYERHPRRRALRAGRVAGPSHLACPARRCASCATWSREA